MKRDGGMGWGRSVPAPKVGGTTHSLAMARLKEGLLISLLQRIIIARSRS